jgi:hypothetical protein
LLASIPNEIADLFPLPLCPIEQFFFFDNQPATPKVFVVNSHFLGKLSRSDFEFATKVIIERHPLLRSVVASGREGLEWQLAPISPRQIVWSESYSAALAEAHESVELTQELGFRVFGWTDGEQSRVLMQYHHAVADGMAAKGVLAEWLAAYSISYGSSDPQILERLCYRSLRLRGQFKFDASAQQPAEASIPLTMRGRLQAAWEFFRSQPVPMRPCLDYSINKNSRMVAPITAEATLPPEIFTSAERRAKQDGFTINDVATALVLQTIARWNRSHGEVGRDRLYRVLIPVNLRDRHYRQMPAANRLSFVFLGRPTSLCLNFKPLLETVRAEMKYIRDHNCQLDFVRILPTVTRYPSLINACLRLPVCFSTAVLTNLGDPMRGFRRSFPQANGHMLCGNLQFLFMGGAPPLRVGTHWAIGITQTGDAMRISSNSDATAIGSGSNGQLLNLLTEAWQEWAQP